MFINVRISAFISICFVFLSCSNVNTGSPLNGANILKNRDQLIGTAKKIAKEEKIDVESCNIYIQKEGNEIIVEFRPKSIFQHGGGGRLFLREEKKEFKLLKIELWQ